MSSSAEPRWREAGTNEAGDRRVVRNVAHAQVESAGDAAVVREYDEMSKDDLSAELERRGLAKTGNKDELIARLQESDAA